MKRVPKLKTDAAAEAIPCKGHLSGTGWFIAVSSLPALNSSAKDAQINMRLPSKLLAAVKASAKSSWHSLSTIYP